ncbi:MAG TPA: MlaD family protein [Solirubrobacteraceae bacterium]|nr:MlaD family protein [Solirubrobacteraceae bacterium]
MKRIAALLVLVLAGAVLIVFATGSGGDGGYRVRAIFDNAAFVIPGEDVKIAGVKVGKIQSLDLTPDNKAAVVLDISNSDYHDFRTDAFCIVRPQGLIGEKFIECEPTQPRLPGAPVPALLPVIKRGPGKGQHLLPSTNTAKAIDIDLINNIMRLPLRERFTIIINELGTGLAGNGAALNAALRKSNPAFKAFDQVLAILAAQNRVLASLAENGDTVLAPLARDRAQIQGFINSSATTATATAERSAALQADIKLFPPFLRQLGPTMNTLGALADQFTPVVQALHRAAPSLNTFVTGTPAFTSAAIPAFKSLGDTADVGGPALEASLPLVQSLGTLSKTAVPLTQNLSAFLTSLRAQGGINRLMDFVFYGAGGTNGYDTYGHYLRARLVLTTCQTFVLQNQPNCTANFNKDLGATTAQPKTAGSAAATAQATGSTAGSATTAGAAPADASPIRLPKALLPGDTGVRRGAGAAQASPAPKKAPDARSVQSLLDYLLGE